jgi:hypothetical protein
VQPDIFLLQMNHCAVCPWTRWHTLKVLNFVKGKTELWACDILASRSMDELLVQSVVGASQPQIIVDYALFVSSSENIEALWTVAWKL